MYCSLVDHRQNNTYAKTRITSQFRDGPGDSRHADITNAGDGTGPRTDHCPRDRARLGGCPPNRARFSVSSVAPAPESRLDCGVLGNIRKQPQGKILPADAPGPKTTRSADVPLGTSGARHRPDPVSGTRAEQVNWRRFFRRKQTDSELQQELEFYADLTAEEYVARGMKEEDARREAKRKLGNPNLIREEIYRMNTIAVAETVWQDIRYACR